MPRFLEDKLRAEATVKGLTGRHADRYVYGMMNNRGLMRGNQETAKGARMDAKHAQDMEASSMPHPHANLGKYLHKPKAKRSSSLAAHAAKFGRAKY